MKFTELLTERKAVAELVESTVLNWIRYREMPGYCEETDPYKWYYLASEDGFGGDPNMDVWDELNKQLIEYFLQYVDEDFFNYIDAEEIISTVLQNIDEDKYGWGERSSQQELILEKLEKDENKNRQSVAIAMSKGKEGIQYSCSECHVEVEFLKPTCPRCHKWLRWEDLGHYDLKGNWHDKK